MNIWDKCWHSTGFSSVITETKQCSQTDGGGKRQWVGGRKLDSFITMENSSKIFTQRKKSFNIHPVLNINRPSPSLPPAVSTSEAETSERKKLEHRGEGRQRGIGKEIGLRSKRCLPPKKINKEEVRKGDKKIWCLQRRVIARIRQ